MQIKFDRRFSLPPLTVDSKRPSGREGGLSSVPLDALKYYMTHLDTARDKLKDKDWLKSIEEFSELIEGDPVLRMNWEYGIYQCTQTLPGKTGDDVLDMVDTACKTAPVFSHSALIGFPINAIFVEFMQKQNGRTFFSHQRVNLALKKILKDYSDMLQSPKSLKYMTDDPDYGWFSPQANEQIHNEWYKCDPNAPHYGYKNWNQWFLREFKDGMRPIGQGTPEGINPDDVIVNACQSSPLAVPVQPILNVSKKNNFWLKDNLYSLHDMFGGIKYKKQWIADHFEGGTVYQAFLSALYYHRWHAPVDGIIQDIYNIDGTYYLDQSQFIAYDEGSPNNSESFLSAVAARQVFLIKAKNPKIGKIAIIFIGMAEVSSCVPTVKIGETVKKGQQLGYFMFGGSSHAIIFEKKANLKFKNDSQLYRLNIKTNQNESIKQNLSSYLAYVE